MPNNKAFVGLRKILRISISFILTLVLLASVCACSGEPKEVSHSPSPSKTMASTPTPSPSPTPTPSPTPSPSPTPTPKPSPSPTPEPSFGELKTKSNGSYEFPQVISDKTSALTGDPVYFKIVTSDKVNKIQSSIDGQTGKMYTSFSTENNQRIWLARIFFTTGGSRRVQFICYTSKGGNVYIPKTPIKINVKFKYTADSTSKNIAKGKTVTFTLKTPSTITTVYSVIDGVKQNIKYTEAASNEGGVKVWKIKITFQKAGERSVQFQAYAGTKLKSTFPDEGIPIIVQ